jgi:hypothetical protein
MAECEWILLCDYAFVVMPGKVSAVGIFDTIFAHGVPTIHPQAFVVFNVLGEPGEHVAATLEIIGPTGKTLAKAEVKATLPDSGGAQTFVALKDLTLAEFGRHALQVDFGDGHPKSAWFTLVRPQAPAG